MDILYFFAKFELDRYTNTNKRDLMSVRQNGNINKHTKTETDTVPPKVDSIEY